MKMHSSQIVISLHFKPDGEFVWKGAELPGDIFADQHHLGFPNKFGACTVRFTEPLPKEIDLPKLAEALDELKRHVLLDFAFPYSENCKAVVAPKA